MKQPTTRPRPTPKQNGSGKGTRQNAGRGGCSVPNKTGRGK